MPESAQPKGDRAKAPRSRGAPSPACDDGSVGRTDDGPARQASPDALGRLAGGIAHRYNDFLTVILGYTEFLERHLANDPATRGALAEIRSAGERAAAMTQELLAYGGSQLLRPAVIDLNGLIGEIADTIRRLAGSTIELRLELDRRIGLVDVDPERFRQVVLKLAENSLDYMPRGGVLTVRTVSRDLREDSPDVRHGVEPGQYVQLDFEDTGGGLDAVALERIFEPFRTSRGSGSERGLGLAAVLGTVRQSGGSLEVGSDIGVGTTFRVLLPRAHSTTVTVAVSEEESSFDHGSRAILVVESDALLRRLVRQILEGYGFGVFEAANGRAALKVFEEHGDRIGLLLSDSMPGNGGEELRERLGSMCPDLKTIYMTAFSTDALLGGSHRTDTSSTLHKPFTPESLYRAVRQRLEE